MIKGLIFDLDGVIVDTAKYHFLAWKALAERLDIPFTMTDNEKLKGVSRVRSLEILLEIGDKHLDEKKKALLRTWKNARYLTYIQALRKDEILPGAKDFLLEARVAGYRTALGSASKNARLILEKLAVANLFDAIIDGTQVRAAKPNPEVFVRGAEALALACEDCLVFEDAAAGILSAHNAGMKAVGVGDPKRLPGADIYIPGFSGVSVATLVSAVTG